MKSIVSLTPASVLKDSRTLKIAASIKRMGYGSTVVEGVRSEGEVEGLPFDLISAQGPGPDKAAPADGGPDSRGLKRHLKKLPEPFKIPFRLAYRTIRLVHGFFAFFTHYVHVNGRSPYRVAPKATLYYLHSFYQFPAVYMLCRKHRATFVYDAHDFYSILDFNYRTFLDRHVFSKVYSFIESRCIQRAAAVVTVSEGVARLQKEKYGCNPLVVRNCHDFRLDRKPSRGLRDMLNLSRDAYLVVVVGQGKTGMAVSEAMEAMTTVDGTVHLAFVGRDYEDHQEGLRGKPHQHRVHIVPPVKPYEVVPFIESADAAMILYFAENANYAACLPNGFFQSVSAGLPLLYPELPEIKKIAEQFGLGIPIDPTSPASIAGGIMALATDSGRSETIRRNARSAGIRLSWEHEETLLHDLLSGLMDENKRA